MRPPYVCAIALAVAVILLSQPVAALTVMEVPYLRAGPMWSIKPMEHADLFILETNMSSLAAAETEALAISFAPIMEDTGGGLAIAPQIAQTSSRTIACAQSYLYQDFFSAV